jgi:hypothetical protein
MENFTEVAAYFWQHQQATTFALHPSIQRPYLDASLPPLPSKLEELVVCQAPNLVGLPVLPASIKSVELDNCQNLKELQLPDTLYRLVLGQLPSLRLRTLPSQLTSLSLRNLPNIADLLPPLPDKLERLQLFNTPGWLPKLPDSLKMLTISKSPIMKFHVQLPSGLEHLILEDCPYLTRLPDLPASLKIVRLSNTPTYFKVGETVVSLLKQ